jgi:hypothetical protein
MTPGEFEILQNYRSQTRATIPRLTDILFGNRYRLHPQDYEALHEVICSLQEVMRTDHVLMREEGFPTSSLRGVM